MYKQCEICTTKKDYGAKIYIYDHENTEDIYLDITEKQIEILYDILKRIREYHEYPKTCEYEIFKENVLWGDKE